MAEDGCGSRDAAGTEAAAAPGQTMERWPLPCPAEVPERMARMARVYGLELVRAGLDPASLIAMTERCGACTAYLDCAEALSEARASPESCGFCPNAALLDEVALRRGERG